MAGAPPTTGRVSEAAIEEIIAGVRKRFEMKPQVAFAGFGKAGKSALFNAIYGADVMRVSMRTDETDAVATRERFGIDFTDTPGLGTARFSFERVAEMGVLDRPQVVVHVLNGASAITEEDERLHDLLQRSPTERITVVNKADLLDPTERAEVAESVFSHLGLREADFLFVSARHGEGVPALVERIADRLPDAMQDAFVAQQQADLALKERRVRALVYSKAAVAGAVGSVPIPVADILVLTPLQIAMVAAIGYFHGVAVDRARAQELVATLTAAGVFREAARQLIKLIPGFGSAVSGGIAFAGTVALGETANYWFKHRMRVEPDTLRSFFREQARRAREAWERERPPLPREVADRASELRRAFEAGELDEATFERRLAGSASTIATRTCEGPAGWPPGRLILPEGCVRIGHDLAAGPRGGPRAASRRWPSPGGCRTLAATVQTLRIVFMGTPDFAVPSLQSLLDGPHEVVAVVTQPDKPKGRGKKVQPPPVKVAAEAAGVEVLQPARIKGEKGAPFRARMAELAPDLVVVAAYGKIVPKALLELPPMGCINVHASLLPRWRGAGPIQRAIAEGDEKTGISIMVMEEGLDTGPVLLEREEPIRPDDTGGTLHDRLAVLGAQALTEALERLQQGTLTPIPQPEEGATYAPMITKEEGRLDFSQPAEVLDRRIRAFQPWPGAFTTLDGRLLKVRRAEVVGGEPADAEPGTVMSSGPTGLDVACAEGTVLRLLEVQPEGRKPMGVDAFLAGHPVPAGRSVGGPS